MSRKYAITSAIIFAVVGLVHLWRAVLDLPLVLGSLALPRSFSVIAGLAGLSMAIWAIQGLRSLRGSKIAYT